jgi:hypothetical protein
VAVSIFNLSGAVNVGLILFTRTNVLRLDYPSRTDARARYRVSMAPDEYSINEGEEGSTGFGGIRVKNPRESSATEGGAVWQGEHGALNATGHEQDSRVPTNRVDTRSTGESGPGRAYLQSLGIQRG